MSLLGNGVIERKVILIKQILMGNLIRFHFTNWIDCGHNFYQEKDKRKDKHKKIKETISKVKKGTNKSPSFDGVILFK